MTSTFESAISAPNIAALPVAIPLLGAALIAALRKWLNRATADTLGILASAATLVCSSALLLRSLGYTQVYWFGNWYPRGSIVLGITFVVDPVGAGLATLAAILVLLGLIFSWHFTNSGSHHYHPLMLVFLAAMSGFALTGDLFNLFVFFELMSTAAFALCGLKTEEPAPLQGAFNFAVTNTIAAFMGLTAIGLLYAVTGALNMAQIGLSIGHRHDPLVIFAFALLTCCFFIKGAIAPFHFWLPDAHAVAPTSVCVLFSGLMVELGLYAVARLYSVIFQGSFAFHESRLRFIFFAFALVTVVLGGFMCYAEHHVKRLLAFSTICHAGLMLLAFSLGGPLALAAMLIYLVAHAFVKSSLFFTSGILLHRLRSLSEPVLFRKGRRLRWTALIWFFGAAGLAAAPPFSLFIGEAAASTAGELAHIHFVSLLFLFGGVMTGAAVFRVGMHTFLGWGVQPITDKSAQVDELPETGEENQKVFWFHFTPAAICLLLAGTITFLPQFRNQIDLASAHMSSQPAYLHSVYTSETVTIAPPPDWSREIREAGLRGFLGVVLAAALACTSVFRGNIARWLRFGAYLEGPLLRLRELQSGHPGDYVLWITVGIAIFGSVSMVLLR